MPKSITPEPAAVPAGGGEPRERELGHAGVLERGADDGLRDADRQPKDFEGALEELEAMVIRMEAGELSLEQSLAAYKRGAYLLQYCQAALKDAQQQVKVLEAGVLQDYNGADDNS